MIKKTAMDIKKTFAKYLFGKSEIDNTPDCMFLECWNNKRNIIAERIASLIIELFPKENIKENKTISGVFDEPIIKSVQRKIEFEYANLIDKVMAEHDLKPLRSKNEFIEFLCRQILKKTIENSEEQQAFINAGVEPK